MSSSVLKILKRSMAAEYSRELSIKLFAQISITECAFISALAVFFASGYFDWILLSSAILFRYRAVALYVREAPFIRDSLPGIAALNAVDYAETLSTSARSGQKSLVEAQCTMKMSYFTNELPPVLTSTILPTHCTRFSQT